MKAFYHVRFGRGISSKLELDKAKKKYKSPGDKGCPQRKLTNEQVREIRAKYKPYIYTAGMLAKEYGVTEIYVGMIVAGSVRPYA